MAEHHQTPGDPVTRARRLRLPLLAATTTAIALCVAGPAAAHIHTDPESVPAGAEATVGFAIQHGCDGSPTTKVEIQLPDGASGISGVDGNGFTSSVDGQVVTFSGGELPDGTEASFQVTFTAPNQPGDVPVKLIQTCAEGVHEWIEVQAEGEAEPESPAPVLTITPAAPSATTTTTQAADTTTTAPATETTQAVTTTTVAPASTTDDAGEDGDDSSAPLVIGGIAALVVLGGGGALYARSRAGRPTD